MQYLIIGDNTYNLNLIQKITLYADENRIDILYTLESTNIDRYNFKSKGLAIKVYNEIIEFMRSSEKTLKYDYVK